MGGSEQGLMIAGSSILDYVVTNHNNSSKAAKKDLPLKKFPLKSTDMNFGPGTVNHKGLRCMVSLGMAYLYKEDVHIHESRFHSFLAIQEIRGHCCVAQANECLSASHGQLNLAWACAGLYLVNKYGTTSQSADLLNALLRWIWTERLLTEACLIPKKEEGLAYPPYPTPAFNCPGWRAQQIDKETKQSTILTTNGARDLFGRILLGGMSWPGINRETWVQKYNLGPWSLLNLLLEAERDTFSRLNPPDHFAPALPYDFYCHRSPVGFIAGFHAPDHVDTCLITSSHKWEIQTIQYGNIKEMISDPEIHYPATEWSKKNRIQRDA